MCFSEGTNHFPDESCAKLVYNKSTRVSASWMPQCIQ